jgi:benzoylformate decarboxylase
VESNVGPAGSSKASPPSVLTVRDAVVALLRRLDMRVVFGNPGSTELPLFRGFPQDFRYVLGLQEAVVVGMADGYAQATHNATFVNLHSAAGVGHAMGNIFTAFKNRTPMVITAGQQARSLMQLDPFLFSNQATELPKPYVKWSCEPARAQDVPQAIARAYYIAMQEPRGPVFVSVPADDWEQPAEPVAERTVSTMSSPEPAVLAQVADALNKARRPAFVVGASVDRAQAWDLVVQLAEVHSARVFAAPMAGRCSFPEDHAQFAGYLLPMREKIVAALDGHDLVFVVGAPAFTYHVEGEGAHVPTGTALMQLTEDPGVAAWTPVGTSVVGNIRLGVAQLLAQAAPVPRSKPAPRVPTPRVATPASGERMPVSYLLQTIADLRDLFSIVVEEAPSARPVMQEHLPILRSGSYYTMCSGGLGYSLPAAVGIAMAQPEKKVVAVIGDGSSMYAIQALWSAAQLQLSMTIVIVKNRRYAALQNFAPVFGYAPDEPVAGTALPEIDFVALARGQGCAGVRVSDAKALEATLRDAMRATGPTLVEVEVQ